MKIFIMLLLFKSVSESDPFEKESMSFLNSLFYI